MNKYISALIMLCFLIAAITGCSNPRMEASDSVLAIYNLYIKGETEGVLELGMTEENINAALVSYDESLISNLKTSMTSAGLTIEDAVLTEIIEARKTALKTMSASCELSSCENGTAVVILKTTYFNETAMDEKAANDAIEKAAQSGSADADELLTLATKYYAQNLIDGYLSVTPSKEIKEITVNCAFSGGVWLPEDMVTFGEDLGLAISGQK